MKIGDKVLAKYNYGWGKTVMTVIDDSFKDSIIVTHLQLGRGAFNCNNLILVNSKEGKQRISDLKEIQMLEYELNELIGNVFERDEDEK